MAADASSLAQVVREEAWRSERALNAFRTAVWLSVGLLSVVLDVVFIGRPGAASLITLAWGVVCGTLVAATLRRGFHALAPALFTILDLILLGVTMDATQFMLKLELPEQAPHQLQATTAGVLTIIATNSGSVPGVATRTNSMPAVLARSAATTSRSLTTSM